MAASTTTGNFKVIGTRPIRHDGVDKVTGRAKYGADYAFPGMLHGKVLRSPHAHAEYQIDQYRQGAEAPRRQGDRHRRGPARGREQARAGRRDGDQPDVPVDEHPGARQGALRRPCDRRRRRDQSAYRRGSAAPDRSRVRSAAAGDDRRRRDEARRADPAARICATRKKATSRPTSRSTTSSSAATSRRDSRPPTTWSSASSTPRWSIRATSSRTTPSASTTPTARRPSTARRRAPSTCARSARRCSGCRSAHIKVVPAEIGGGFGGKTTRLSRAAGGAALEEDRPPGQDGHDRARKCCARPARLPARRSR